MQLIALKKNVIQQQADDFMRYVITKCGDHKHFMEHCGKALLNYKKNMHCIVFLERLQELVKANQDRHLQFCTAHYDNACRFTKFYKVILFYIKNEIDHQEKDLPFTYFRKNERRLLDHDLENILTHLPALKQNNRNNYIKLRLELNEMKSYYFLDKKNWKQLLLGKVLVLENTQVITHEQSTSLIEKIEERFFSVN